MSFSETKKKELLSQFTLENRVAVVTGSGRGIGKEIALTFAGVGAHIVVADLNASGGEETADSVHSLNRKVLQMTVDATDHLQVKDMVDETLKVFGRIDILVNNVGGGGPHSMMAPIFEMSEETWDSALTANLKSTFLCTKLFGRVMKDQKRGTMINISSVTGMRPHPLMAQYGAAKAGIINFTQSMAVYLAPHNIRVNCIAPGLIATPGTSILGDPQERAKQTGIPLMRAGNPADVAFAALYLASDAADFITGIVIEISGGPYLGGVLLKHAEKTWNVKES